MHIRPITRSDLVPLLDIFDTAFIDDELHTLVFPHRYERPEAYRDDLHEYTRIRMVRPGVCGFVVVADPEDTTNTPTNAQAPTEGQVMGFAWYERHPDGKLFDPSKTKRSATLSDEEAKAAAKKDLAKNTGPWQRFELMLCKVQMSYRLRVGVMGASADPRRLAELTSPVVQDDTMEGLPSHWYLALIGVNPRFQRRGVGTMLIRHGKAMAEASGVPLTLISAPKEAQRLYTKHEGFKIVGWSQLFHDFTFEGGAHCIWDPWGAWVRECEEKVVDDKGRKAYCEWVS